MWDWNAHAIENLGRFHRREMMREARRQRLARLAVEGRGAAHERRAAENRARARILRVRQALGMLLVDAGTRLGG
ncbi:MAG: hypothetical protein HY660_03675 [Armatimonadetes bacterium]|nr:hypothetical protein [Armatimonadota bacterium]